MDEGDSTTEQEVSRLQLNNLTAKSNKLPRISTAPSTRRLFRNKTHQNFSQEKAKSLPEIKTPRFSSPRKSQDNISMVANFDSLSISSSSSQSSFDSLEALTTFKTEDGIALVKTHPYTSPPPTVGRSISSYQLKESTPLRYSQYKNMISEQHITISNHITRLEVPLVDAMRDNNCTAFLYVLNTYDTEQLYTHLDDINIYLQNNYAEQYIQFLLSILIRQHQNFKNSLEASKNITKEIDTEFNAILDKIELSHDDDYISAAPTKLDPKNHAFVDFYHNLFKIFAGQLPGLQPGNLKFDTNYLRNLAYALNDYQHASNKKINALDFMDVIAEYFDKFSLNQKNSLLVFLYYLISSDDRVYFITNPRFSSSISYINNQIKNKYDKSEAIYSLSSHIYKTLLHNKQNPQLNFDILLRLEDIILSHNKNIVNITEIFSGNFHITRLHAVTDSIAQDLQLFCMRFFTQLPSAVSLKPSACEPLLQDITNIANQLSNKAIYDILNATSEVDRANKFDFYMLILHKFCTFTELRPYTLALNLSAALDNSHISRLKALRHNTKYYNLVEKYRKLFSPDDNFAEMKKNTREYDLPDVSMLSHTMCSQKGAAGLKKNKKFGDDIVNLGIFNYELQIKRNQINSSVNNKFFQTNIIQHLSQNNYNYNSNAFQELSHKIQPQTPTLNHNLELDSLYNYLRYFIDNKFKIKVQHNEIRVQERKADKLLKHSAMIMKYKHLEAIHMIRQWLKMNYEIEGSVNKDYSDTVTKVLQKCTEYEQQNRPELPPQPRNTFTPRLRRIRTHEHLKRDRANTLPARKSPRMD